MPLDAKSTAQERVLLDSTSSSVQISLRLRWQRPLQLLSTATQPGMRAVPVRSSRYKVLARPTLTKALTQASAQMLVRPIPLLKLSTRKQKPYMMLALQQSAPWALQELLQIQPWTLWLVSKRTGSPHGGSSNTGLPSSLSSPPLKPDPNPRHMPRP